MFENKSNIISLKGAFSVEEDPSRWETFLILQAENPVFLLSNFDIFVFQVQVCALSPVPRHSVVSPPGCLLGRPLLPHPRPRRLGIWKARGDQRFVLDRVAAAFFLQWRAVFNGFTGLLCGPPLDFVPSCLEPERRPLILGRKIPAYFGEEVAFSVELLQAICWALWCMCCLYMYLQFS